MSKLVHLGCQKFHVDLSKAMLFSFCFFFSESHLIHNFDHIFTECVIRGDTQTEHSTLITH